MAERTTNSPGPANARTDDERFLGSVRVDEDGSRWIAVKVDRDEVGRPRDAVRARIESELGTEPVGGFGQSVVLDEPAEEVYTPWRWDWRDCSVFRDVGKWNGESRQLVSPGYQFPTEERAVVFQVLDTNGVWQMYCNGTVVSPGRQLVLTAGHCVDGGAGPLFPPASVRVCTYGNYQGVSQARCATATGFTTPPGWNGSSINDDYALVSIDRDLGVGYMGISGTSDSVLQNAVIHRVAHPAYDPTASNWCSLSPLYAGENLPMSGGELFRQQDTGVNVTANRICTHQDGSAGESGSAFYYCANSNNNLSQCNPYIAGVLHGPLACGLSSYVGGVKGPALKAWAEAMF